MGQEFAVRMLAKVGPYKFKEEFLETLLNDAIEKIQASKHYKNQSLQEPLQSENIFIRVDSRLFLWALDQLLEKAIAETPENAVIDIQYETSLLQDSAAKQVCIHIAYTAAQAVPLQKPITTDLQLLDSIIEKHQGSMQAQQTDSRVDLRICLPCLVH
jgi:K+-sensing histidine kinase KdpD